jgi:transcriptional regulator GlxA family with amidase domain
MLNERIRPREFQRQAESAWLRLLLISVHRWVTGEAGDLLTPDAVNPELVRLWHLVNASVGQPAEFHEQIHTLPNYDSLRHGFKRAFGCSPRDMMLRLRIQHAKNLLLETNLSIKEIADRSGYQRQHEFARAFRQHTGAAPTVWRAQPFMRSETAGR